MSSVVTAPFAGFSSLAIPKPDNVFATRACSPEQPEIGEARLSAPSKQPAQVGFPYQIHIPAAVLRALGQANHRKLEKIGVTVEPKQPLFLKTNERFVRMNFPYGKKQYAEEVLALIKAGFTSRAYKNWA